MYIRDRKDGYDVIVEQGDSMDETSHITEVIVADMLKLISEVKKRGCNKLAVSCEKLGYDLMAEYKNKQWHFYYSGNMEYQSCFSEAFWKVYNLGEIKKE